MTLERSPIRCTSVLAAFLAIAAATGGHSQRRAEPDTSLVGLWAGRIELSPVVRGTLVLERAAEQWRATIADRRAFHAAGRDTVLLAFPDAVGDLRIHVRSGEVVSAMWIQPAGAGPRYATPVRLRRVGDGAWRGEVEPHDERFTLFLSISRDSAGLRGVYRNPDVNWTGGAPWFSVVRDRDTIRFVDPRTGRVRWTQPFDSIGRRIEFDFGQPLHLAKVAGDYPGFRARQAGVGPAYRPPAAGDEWPSGRAAAAGLDESALGAVVRRIATADPTSAAPRIHSLLVARGGRLVLEEYFYGLDASVPHDLRSASKTFTSILAGVAMDRGAPFTMATPAFALLGADSSLLASDRRRSRITVGHLLTHTSGLACDDSDDESPGHEDRMQSQTAEPDWYGFTMGLTVVADPGSRYAYCSAGINLAGGVVAATTGAWLPALFEEAVARPLDIGRYAINLMPDGQGYSAGGVYLRPRDLLKIGQLYLDGGRWRGRRVVSAGWVRESTAAQVAADNGSSDGYGWHRYAIPAGGTTHQEIEASGNGGQFLVLIPSLDLVIASTGGNYGEYRVWKRFRDEIVPAVISAAMAGRTGSP